VTSRPLGAHTAVVAARSGSLSRWRDGGGDDWPTDWPSRAEHWPSLENQPWTPTREGPAVIVCIRGRQNPMRLVSFESADDAREADVALFDRECGPGCLRLHYRVWCTPGALHVEPGYHDPPPVPHDLGKALRAAGYHEPGGLPVKGFGVIRPEDCPAPTRWNPPLWKEA
jgi:hypothetical protein